LISILSYGRIDEAGIAASSNAIGMAIDTAITMMRTLLCLRTGGVAELDT